MRYLKFLDGSIDPGLAMLATYDPSFVTLSYVIASLASYTALGIAGRISAAERTVGKWKWLVIGAMTMGSGVWAMHFIGMLAYRLPVTVMYDLPTTLLSMVPAILAGGVALHVISRAKIGGRRLIVGGTLMGAGIGVMHYSGMAAIRMDAFIRYDPVLFGVSIIVAVLLAIAALYIKFWVSGRLAKPHKHVTELGSALVMGLAVAGMHYTAMQSTYYFATGVPTGVDAVFSPTLLGASVGAVSIIIITLSIIATVVGRRLEAAASTVLTSRRQMLEAIEGISDGFALYDAEDRLVLCNTRYREGLSEISDILKPGVRFEKVIRASAERGLLPDANEHVEDFVREALHRHRTLGKLVEQPFGDDRWVQTNRFRTMDGGTVLIHRPVPFGPV